MKKLQCCIALAAIVTLSQGVMSFAETMPQEQPMMHQDSKMMPNMMSHPEPNKLSAESHKPQQHMETKKEEIKEEKKEEIKHPNQTMEKHEHKAHKTTWETKPAPSNASKEAPKH